MKKSTAFFILSSLIFTACNEHIEDNYKDGMIQHATMYAHNFISEPEDVGGNTRSILTPASDGTHFAWADGDITAVFSSGNGMTNFNIDATTISSDGTSAEFNGAGFSLKSFSAYYAFYPYSASNLNKNKVYVDYNNQNMQSNGCFKDLGSRDFMWAVGTTNDKGEVSFDFQHLGCVVDFKLTAPASANYSQVRFELESNVDNAKLIKYGHVDLTSSNPSVIATTSAESDTIMKVNLNSGNGLTVKKDSIIHLYMMMAPQDLSAYKMIVRLVDTDNKWYSAEVCGKNMKAGYTYHYVIAEDSKDGGFTGSGTGLPDENTLRMISTYTHPTAVPYYDFYLEKNNLYAVCETGVRKIDYTNESSPELILENALCSSSSCLMGRSIASKDNLLYLGLRQNSSGDKEKLVPEISQSFEGPITNQSNLPLSNNSIVNTFFSNLQVSIDLCKVSSMVVCKAYKKSETNFVNAIILKVSGENDYVMYSSTHSTKTDALNSLPSHMFNAKGDMCDLDWSCISEGSQTIRMSFNFYTGMTASSKLSSMMTITDDECPGYGLKSGLFVLDGSTDNKTGTVTYSLPNNRTEGELSFWLKVDQSISGTVYIPLFTNYTTSTANTFSATLKNRNEGYGIAIENTTPGTTLTFGRWYNIKASYNNGKKTIYYREQECSEWTQIATANTSANKYNRISIGIAGRNTTAQVHIDEFRYKQANLDDFSYVNGKIAILDKANLSVKKTLNLDYKVTGIGVKDDVLVVNCLNAVNIYSIQDANNPKLVYTYRPLSFRDIQSIAFFDANGKHYAMSCKYNKGVIIFDITDVNNVQVVADDEFDDLLYHGKSAVANHFDAVVDYPYVYMTTSPIPAQIGNMRDATGVLVLNISDFDHITKETVSMPLKDITTSTVGDSSPIHIAKFNDKLYLNNREKGLAVFNITSPGNVDYEGLVEVNNASVNCIKITSDGRMFLGDDNGYGDSRNIYFLRFE